MNAKITAEWYDKVYAEEYYKASREAGINELGLSLGIKALTFDNLIHRDQMWWDFIFACTTGDLPTIINQIIINKEILDIKCIVDVIGKYAHRTYLIHPNTFKNMNNNYNHRLICYKEYDSDQVIGAILFKLITHKDAMILDYPTRCNLDEPMYQEYVNEATVIYYEVMLRLDKNYEWY